jgi:NADH-quinone oxidoreductase subunit G
MPEKTEIVAENSTQNMVSLTIDKHQLSVPEGTLVVDAAKRIGVDIPVFCYHPKMEPVGMCRMCLVEIGRPAIDRGTGEAILNEDGTPRIDFAPKLETGCTIPVSEGMVVRGYTDEVAEARDDVLEFLLTSHPLDCPICDKGGECPLQNLTMNFAAGESRFIYDEKIKLDKHVPLGEMMFLDRERCIQCARCTRFQSEIVDDPVIGFSERGRALEIVTFSDPGFDSYWSGNTSDICPVGALTTADFRFGARPWEMDASASVCNQCSVGCNTTLNTRREAKRGGKEVVKRIMPRQNEQVNEIWICDKGRFGYHYTESDQRLTQPLVRKDDQLEPATWEEALSIVAQKFGKAGTDFLSLSGGLLSNEDYFHINQLTQKIGGQALLDSQMAGGDLVAQVGLGQGTNLGELGSGDTVLVVASDLEEEAPLYWLRIKQAAERGANLIVANPRRTKLDARANRTLRYEYGQEASLVQALLDSLSPKRPEQSDDVKALQGDVAVKAAAEELAAAENLIVIYGSEGTSLASSTSLANACANLLIATGHVGRRNNGLLAIWDKANTQGAWDMGLHPSPNIETELVAAKSAYIQGADPLGDNPALKETFDALDFLVVQEISMTETAAAADVVLPAQAITEREGSLTNAERRVQRYYPAVSPADNTRPDFAIAAAIAADSGLKLETRFAASAFTNMAAVVSDYAELNFAALAETQEQWPIIGRDDVYYGGTTYDNSQGLGVQLISAAERGESPSLSFEPPFELDRTQSKLYAVPITQLYDQGNLIKNSPILGQRLETAHIVLSPKDATKRKLELNASCQINIDGQSAKLSVKIDNSIPAGFVLLPRSLGISILQPTEIEVKAA